MTNRILSFLLAAIMVITFALPVSAMETLPVQDVIDMTGGTEIVFGGEEIPPVQTENETEKANAPPAEDDISLDDSDDSEEDISDTGDEEEVATAEATPATTESGNFLLDCTPEQAAKLIAYYKYIKAQIEQPTGIQLFSAPGDSGTVSWTWGEAVGIDVPSGDPGNPYHIGNIPSLTLSTANPPIGRAFCVEFGVDPGGAYTASEGSNNQILSLLVAFEKGQASAVGVQLALWYIVNGLPLSGQSQAAAALSAASSVDTTGYTYYLWNSGSGQPFVTLDNSPTDEPDDKDKEDEDEDEEEENPNTRTEVTSESSTRTEVRSSTTYEYSDAAVLNGLTDEWYSVTEVRSPTGYLLDSTPKVVQLLPGKTTTIKINNHKKPSLTIKKIDEQTGATIPGVVLRVTKDGAMEYRDVTTGASGTAVITDMEPGWVTIVEQKAKDGYILDQTPHHIQLKPGEDAQFIITNKHKPSLKIIKLDSVTKQPIQYVTFDIAVKNGAPVGSYTTNADGEIYLENINPDTYVISERPFDGYIALTSEKEVIVEWGKLTTVEFLNQPKNPLLIKKIDSETGEPLSGAVFTVTKVNGEFVGEYTTGRNGFITVTGLLPGFFVCKEVKSPQGYILDSTPKTVELKLNQPAEVTFENKPLNGIQILKIDAQTREPLEGVKFVVREKGGRTIGEYTTDANGLIDVQGLEPGWYQVYESASLPGYLLDSNVRDVEFTWNGHVLLEFTNTKLSGLQVRKVDSVTKEPLQGVKFRVTKMNGEYVGDYVTGVGGYFAVADLEPDWYTAYETATIAGYILDATPQNVQIKKSALAVLDFENKPLSGLQIRKTDSVTGLPLSGVEFKVSELSGRLVGNYTTDSAGLVFVPNLKEGWYVCTETKALSGYKPDTAPRNVEIKTGELNVVEYKNRPYPVFVLRKIDADTLQPLEGVRFRLLDRYQREIGIFKTNSLGQIMLTGMDEGSYYCQEVEAKAGYVLDSTVREVSLQWGKTTTLEVKNTPMATLRIKKVDSVTGKPIPGVTFLLYDWKNNLLGEYLTDNNGIIELPKTIAAGKYKLKETKTDPAYVLDDQMRTIEVKSGETTEIVIENEPKRGRIQIVKKAAAENPITKDKAGATLAGAVFEVYDKNLNIVDTITTDKNGVATTIDLPLGVYGLKETKSPDFYFTDGNVFYGELKIHGDLVRFEVLNNPADISVTVEKRGNDEVIAGDEMRYDFSEISNTSNIPLENFFWHDKLPTEAVRLKTIHTGTWNESLTYSVVYKTNLKSGYKALATNLSSKTSHTLDCSPARLKLAANEYITDIRFEFGTVKAGFREDEAPSFVVTTLSTLPDGHRIVNHTDVSGTTGGKTVTAQDTWVTVALGKPKGCLPRTGF